MRCAGKQIATTTWSNGDGKQMRRGKGLSFDRVKNVLLFRYDLWMLFILLCPVSIYCSSWVYKTSLVWCSRLSHCAHVLGSERFRNRKKTTTTKTGAKLKNEFVLYFVRDPTWTKMKWNWTNDICLPWKRLLLIFTFTLRFQLLEHMILRWTTVRIEQSVDRPMYFGSGHMNIVVCTGWAVRQLSKDRFLFFFVVSVNQVSNFVQRHTNRPSGRQNDNIFMHPHSTINYGIWLLIKIQSSWIMKEQTYIAAHIAAYLSVQFHPSTCASTHRNVSDGCENIDSILSPYIVRLSSHSLVFQSPCNNNNLTVHSYFSMRGASGAQTIIDSSPFIVHYSFIHPMSTWATEQNKTWNKWRRQRWR